MSAAYTLFGGTVDHMNPVVLFGDLIEKLAGTIGRTIIKKQEIKIQVQCFDSTVNNVNMFPLVIGGNEHENFSSGHIEITQSS